MLRAQAAKTRLENEAKMETKKAVTAFQRQMDAEMMKKNMDLLDKQEREREEAQKAFHDRIAAK